jgi:fructokinase
MSKVICLGEALIDFVPEKNGSALKDVFQFQRTPGGAPANVSAAISLLGGKSYFIGKVGADSFGDFLEEVLQGTGVQTQYLRKTKDAKTALAFVSLNKNGERDFLFYRDPSADMLLKAEELDPMIFSGDGIYHFGSVTLITEPSRSATMHGLELAEQNGLIISYDPNIRLPLWSDHEVARAEILKPLSRAHIVKVSDDELTFLAGEEDEAKAIEKMMTGSVKLLVVTRGRKGCSYYTPYQNGSVEGYPVDAVDTTGAGDAFVGALLYHLHNEVSTLDQFENLLKYENVLKKILYFANVCGAITTTRRGAISALPSFEEIKNIIDRI